MSHIVFLLEERSMAVLLDGLLPRSFPDLSFQCVPHEGKRDSEKSLRTKLFGWSNDQPKIVCYYNNAWFTSMTARLSFPAEKATFRIQDNPLIHALDEKLQTAQNSSIKLLFEYLKSEEYRE